MLLRLQVIKVNKQFTGRGLYQRAIAEIKRLLRVELLAKRVDPLQAVIQRHVALRVDLILKADYFVFIHRMQNDSKLERPRRNQLQPRIVQLDHIIHVIIKQADYMLAISYELVVLEIPHVDNGRFVELLIERIVFD
jgi:hypothetical protein